MKQQIDLNSGMGEGFGPWLIGDGIDDEIARGFKSRSFVGLFWLDFRPHHKRARGR